MTCRSDLRRLSLAVAFAVLWGCGTSAPSKARYITEADAICRQSNRAIDKVRQPQVSGVSANQILDNYARYVDALLPVAQGTLSQLQALTQPAADHAPLQRYLASVDSGIKQLRTLSVLATKHDPVRFQSAVAVLRSNSSNQLATQYGFKVCGGAGGTTAG